MYQICKTHRTCLQLISVSTRLNAATLQVTTDRCFSHMGFRSRPTINQLKTRIHHLNCCYLSTEAKEVTKSAITSEEQVNRSDDSKDVLLFCPKRSQMYDIFSNGEQPVQHLIRDKINLKTIDGNTKDVLNNDDKSLNLLDTCDEWKPIAKLVPKTLLKYYTQLAKLRLTGLVVLTTLSGYYMGLQGPLDPSILTATLLGTALTSGSATAINQLLEVPFDSQMKRTQNRPLVLGRITPLHAFGFAVASGVTGLTLLSYVNPLTAVLGASNLLLYSFIYTPMKRAHIANTWVGAVVGAIPPVMGFTAANNFIDLSAILMGLLLYSWQFPHFNALSWNMRHEYARAGFRMMSVTEPKLCLNTAFRHSCLILVYSSLMCTSLTTWTFGLDSLPVNLYLIYLSWKFRSNPDAKSSRKLFFYSLIHLPAVILLMCISKRRKSSDVTPTVV